MLNKSVLANFVTSIFTFLILFMNPSIFAESIESNISIKVTPQKEIIYQYEPLTLEFLIKNNSKKKTSVTPPAIGSIRTMDMINASLILDLQLPDGSKDEIVKLRPYFLDIADYFHNIPKSKIEIDPDSSLGENFTISGNWTIRRNKLLFNEIGDYILFFSYFPFTKMERGFEVFDKSKASVSNKVEITVKELSDDDKSCYEKLRKNPFWFYIYDVYPEEPVIPDREQIKLFLSLCDELVQEYPESLFADYLRYASVLVKVKAMAIRNVPEPYAPPVDKDDLIILEDLSKKNFTYREVVEQMKSKLKMVDIETNSGSDP